MAVVKRRNGVRPAAALSPRITSPFNHKSRICYDAHNLHQNLHSNVIFLFLICKKTRAADRKGRKEVRKIKLR